MELRFTIPDPMLRSILRELRHQPSRVAIGPAGVNALPDGNREVIARSYRLIREEALRQEQGEGPARFELGFVPFALSRPQVWEAVAFASTVEGRFPDVPTYSILLGSGDDAGLFTGICSEGRSIKPITQLRMPGAGMHSVAAINFQVERRAVPAEDAERWGRMIGALGGEGTWMRFRSLRFCIVGAGRTGSLIAASLARHGARQLALVDRDFVELPNLDAMHHVTYRDVGRLKVDALTDNLRGDFPGLHLEPIPRSISANEGLAAFKAADVVIGCVDDNVARLELAGLTSSYAKPYLDIGSGIFLGDAPAHPASLPGTQPRTLGGDIRLIIPGDGCLLCWGSVQNLAETLRRWRNRDPLPAWNRQRAGSLGSLNGVAANLGMRLLEDMIAGRLTRSIWLRYETDERGIPSLRQLNRSTIRDCPFCSIFGAADLLSPVDRSTLLI